MFDYKQFSLMEVYYFVSWEVLMHGVTPQGHKVQNESVTGNFMS